MGSKLPTFVFLSFLTGLFGIRSWADSVPATLPRGFFIEDLSKKPPVPAFYNLETNQVQPFAFRQNYVQFIDFSWDRERQRVFFSARKSREEPFRIYLKNWPDGEEKPVFESPVGPFRFLLSPDGHRFALQIMGSQAWPTVAVCTWEDQRLVALGQGYSPDWSVDGQRLLFLQIPGSLPSYLSEYRVDTDTATRVLPEPVAEAVYTDDADQMIVKTARQSKRCDIFQVWNRHIGKFKPFCLQEIVEVKGQCPIQREIGAFPGHQFFFFQESRNVSENDRSRLVVTDLWGGRLQSLDPDDWQPRVNAVEATSLVVGEDPLYLVPADGTGGRREIPQVSFIQVGR
jgi:hypothetical protein